MNRNGNISTSDRESFWGSGFQLMQITVARQLVTYTRFTLFTAANISDIILYKRFCGYFPN